MNLNKVLPVGTEATPALPWRELCLRHGRGADLFVLERWLLDPQAAWRSWDAPYLPADLTSASLLAYVQQWESHLGSPDELVIEVAGQVVGLVNRREEEPTGGGWWDLGILLLDDRYWGQGLGTRALGLWVQDTWEWTDAHVVTVTTWSGNQRMIRSALRLGFRECMRVREARVVNGERYDSVRLDLLRSEWSAQGGLATQSSGQF